MSRRRTETETVPEKENDRNEKDKKEKDKKEKPDKKFSSTLSRVLGSRTRSLSRQGSSHEVREKSASPTQPNDETPDLKDSLHRQTEKVKSMTRMQESLAALEEKLANERRELANGRAEMECQLAEREIILKEMVCQVEEKERERQQMAYELEAIKTEKVVLEGVYATVKGQKEARPDLEKHVLTLTRQKMELERFREMLEKRVEDLTDQLQKANREKAAQLTELEAERATLEKWKAKISAALKMKLEEAQKNSEYLEADKEEAERDVARLVKVNKELEDKVVALEAELKSSCEKLDVLVQRVKKDEMTKLDMEEEMRKLRAELQELVTDGKKAEKESSIAKVALEAAVTQRDKVQTNTNAYLETMRVEILALKEEAEKAAAAATAASKMKERANLKRITNLEGELELAISEKEANKASYDVRTAVLEKKVRELTEKLAESTKENLQLAGVAEKQQTQVTTMLSEMAKCKEGENQRLSDGRTIEVLKANIACLDLERKSSEKRREEQIATLVKELNGAHIDKVQISTEMKQMAQRRDEESQGGVEGSHGNAFLDVRQGELGPEIKESELSQELKGKTQELQLIRGERDSLKLKLEIMEQKAKMMQSIFPWCSCMNQGEE